MRARRKASRNGLFTAQVSPSVFPRPIRALRTGLAFRIIFSFFMPAAQYLCDRGYRNGFVLADVSEYFIRNFFIQPRIRLSRMPSPHDGFSAFLFYYADGHLCSFAIIRPVIGHGRYRESAETLLRFLDDSVPYYGDSLHAIFGCGRLYTRSTRTAFSDLPNRFSLVPLPRHIFVRRREPQPNRKIFPLTVSSRRSHRLAVWRERD